MCGKMNVKKKKELTKKKKPVKRARRNRKLAPNTTKTKQKNRGITQFLFIFGHYIFIYILRL